MNDEKTQVMEIDIKDILCFILKHIVFLVMVSAIFAFAGAAYSFYKQANATPTSSVLDTSVKLPGESDEAYNNRIANVERANDIKANISVLTEQVAIQNDYINNSVYMQIDPLNVAISQAQVVVSCDNSNAGGLEAIYNAYKEDIATGDYIENVADSLNCSIGAVQELITIDFDSSNLTNTDSLTQMGIMTIRVIGTSVENSNLIMDAIIAELELKSTEFKSSIISHEVTVVGIQSSVGYDAIVRQKQLDSVTTLNNIQTQINNLNINLDNTAKILGLADRTSFYDSLSVEKTAVSEFSFKGTVKFAAVGALLGFVFIAGVYALLYVFGRNIVSQEQFFSLFNTTKIGVCKPVGKRSMAKVLLDLWSEDDKRLTEETLNSLIALNYANLTADKTKVLITGTVDSEAVKASIKKLDLSGDVKLGFYNNPNVLKTAHDYEAIVLVEQRGVSNKKEVKEQIRLLNNSGTSIIGAILL